MQRSPNYRKERFLLLLPFLLLGEVSFAQYYQVKERVQHLQTFDNRTLHYGYFFGFNNYGYKIEYVDNYSVSPNRFFGYDALGNEKRGLGYPNISLVKNTGFNVGLVGDLRLHKYLNLRFEPGLYYSQRDLMYPTEIEGINNEADQLREVKSTYIHLPLLLKINAERINNWRPFLVGGMSTAFNLSSNEKNSDDNLNNVFRVTSQTFNYEVGFGIEFYLSYFKFSPSIRGIFSIENELIPDVSSGVRSPWTSYITNMRSEAIVINLTFE